MFLPKDVISGTYTKPRVFLCEPDKTKICLLETSDLRGSFKFHSYSTLNFNVASVYNNIMTGQIKLNPYYNKIEAVRLVELEGFGFFEIQDPEIDGDGIKEIKSITAYSSEYTLSQKYLEKLYINKGTVDSVEVLYAEEHHSKTIIPVVFYNPNNPELSLLDLILEKIYGWKIGHVDASLRTMSRQFEIERESVYDFIMNEICKQFNCYVVFDTYNNTINFYTEALTNKFIGDGSTKSFTVIPAFAEIGSVSIDGYKTTSYTYNAATGVLTLNSTPTSGAMIEVTDGSLSSWETDVYVTFDNLAQQMNISYSADDIKTVLTVKGADDLDIREVNNGLPYIVDLSYFHTVDWMGQDLYDAYNKYVAKCASSQTTYKNNAQEVIKYSNKIWYETNRLSLQYATASVSSDTVGTYYVRGGDSSSGYYFTEVSLPSAYVAGTTYYSVNTTNLTEEKVSDLYKALQTYYSTGDVTGFSDSLINAFEFTKVSYPKGYTLSGVKSTLSSNSTSAAIKDQNVVDFLTQVWAELGLTPLKTLYLDPYKTIQTTNVSAGWAEKNNSNYGLYYPVVLIIKSLNTAIKARQATIDSLTNTMTTYSDRNIAIGKSLLLENNFTDEQMLRLNAFLREDEYTDDNFVATGNETTEELFKLKQELFECGHIELSKLCEPCLKFSMSLANIYALPEFAPIVNQFQLGNLIKVALRPDYVKNTRLMQVDLNFEDFSDFSCEFGDLMSIRSQSDLHADLLSQAVSAGKTVASSASYWNKGTDTANNIDVRVQQGLLSAATEIKSIDSTQNVVIDNYGIHLQEKDPNTGGISDKQGWIVNNKFLYSDDAFKTAKSVFGEYTIDGQTYWGLLAEAVIAGYIEGSTIVGGSLSIGSDKANATISSDGRLTCTGADIAGAITATSLTLGDNVSVSSKNIQGLSTVATSGSYNDLNNKPAIPTSVEQLGLDTSSIVYKGNIQQTVEIDSNGIEYVKTTVPSISGNITYSTYDADDYIVFGRSKGTDSTGNNYVCISKDGLLTARNALIYGTIYATDGEFVGDITANSLTLGNGVTVPYEKISDTPDLTVYIAKDGTVGSTPADGSTGFKVSKQGLLTASNAVIYGTVYSSAGNIAGWTIHPGLLRKETTVDNVDYQIYMQSADGVNTSNAFAVRKKASGSSDWDVQFAVNYAGKLTAKNANITGTITATDGSIAGYNIGSGGSYGNAIYKRVSGTNAQYEVGLKASNGETDLAFYVKESTDNWASSSNNFWIRNNGHLYAKNAEIEGKITASSGTISGNLNISGGLINTRGNHTVTLRGVQEDVTKGVFYITDNTSGSAEYPVRINGDGSARFTNVTITGSSSIASACIPNLSADKITAGTLDVDRIPNLSADKITSGTISTSRLSSSVITTSNFSSQEINANQITAGTISASRLSSSVLTTSNFSTTSLSTSSLTCSGGVKLGNWSITSSGSLYSVSGSVGVSFTPGSLSVSPNGYTSWTNVLKAGQNASDKRLKKNIFEFDSSFDRIFDSLKPVRFEYSTEFLDKGVHFGYLAQDVIKAFEDEGKNIEDYSFVYEAAVGDNPDAQYYQLNQTEFMALNTWQIQKLKKEVRDLQKEIQELKEMIVSASSKNIE